MWNDRDLALLLENLDALQPPFEPLDASAIDGLLVGVLLQPRPVAESAWWPLTVDPERRVTDVTALDAPAVQAVRELVRRRHALLDAAIEGRQWFDPLVFEPDDRSAQPSDAVVPWVAGFAMAQEAFAELQAIDDPALLEPMALLYRCFDAEDLEDAQDLLALIEDMEPAATLDEAVEDLVTATLLIADVSRPLRPGPVASPAPRARSHAPASGRRHRR